MEVLKKMKNSERGSVTVYVLSTLLVLILIAITVYVNMANKATSQEKQVNKIQDGYSVSEDEMNEEYNNGTKGELEIGDTVTYTPSGTYNWQARYYSATKNQDMILNSANAEFKIIEWKVLEIKNETVTLLPIAPTDGRIILSEAPGYNNAVKLLNDACNNLYANPSKGISARSIKIDDINDKLNNLAWNEIYGPNSNYNTQPPNEFTGENSTYPIIYPEEKNAVVSNAPNDGNLGESEQPTLLERDYMGAYDGRLILPTARIRPYNTYWTKENDYLMTAFKKADNGVNYYDLFFPKGNTTNYVIATRCISNGPMNAIFAIRHIYNGTMSGMGMYDSNDGTHGAKEAPLFPVLTLNRNSIIGNKTEGYFVK